MKLRTNSKNPIKRFQQLSNNKQGLVLAILVAVGFFGYQAVNNYLDKRKFERIESSVSELTQRLDDKFDVSVIENSRFCQRESRKFESGPLNCYSSRTIISNGKTAEEIRNYLLSQSDIIIEDEVGFSSFGLKNEDVSCTVQENSANALYPSRHLSTPYKNPKAVLVYYYCSDRASKSHYQYLD